MQYTLPSLIRTLFFQPRDEDLPQGGEQRHLSFQFNLAPMDVQEISHQFHHDVVIYQATASFRGASSAAVNVFAQIYQIHNGMQIPIFSKPAPLSIAFGSGQRPNPFMPPGFFPAGDSVTIQLRSQDRINSLNAECVLWGTTVNWQTVDQFQNAVLQSKRSSLDNWKEN